MHQQAGDSSLPLGAAGAGGVSLRRRPKRASWAD
jgi:hypothetical protein